MRSKQGKFAFIQASKQEIQYAKCVSWPKNYLQENYNCYESKQIFDVSDLPYTCRYYNTIKHNVHIALNITNWLLSRLILILFNDCAHRYCMNLCSLKRSTLNIQEGVYDIYRVETHTVQVKTNQNLLKIYVIIFSLILVNQVHVR